MKLLIDFLPIAIFFLVYKMNPEAVAFISPLLNSDQLSLIQAWPAIILATAVLIPATIVQILYTRVSTGKFETMHLVTLALVVVMGGATVILQDKTFIQWKPTVVNWLFAAAFLGSQFIGERNFLQRMMSQAMTLPQQVWRNLNFAWIIFFIISGFANLYVAYNFSEDTWVNFKLFGLMGMTIAFIILQSLFLYKYIHEDEQTPSNDPS